MTRLMKTTSLDYDCASRPYHTRAGVGPHDEPSSSVAVLADTGKSR